MTCTAIRPELQAELDACRAASGALRTTIEQVFERPQHSFPEDQFQRLVIADALVSSVDDPALHMAVSAHAHWSRRKAMAISNPRVSLTDLGCPPDAVDSAFGCRQSRSAPESLPVDSVTALSAGVVADTACWATTCSRVENLPVQDAARATPGPLSIVSRGRAFLQRHQIGDLIGDAIGAVSLFAILFILLFFAEVFR